LTFFGRHRDLLVSGPITDFLWYLMLAVNVLLFVGGAISLFARWSTMSPEQRKKWLFWVIL